MGKYDAIIDGLEALQPQNPKEASFQLKVQGIKSHLINDSELIKEPRSLAKEYADLRLAKRVLKKQLADIELSLEAFAQMLTATKDMKDPAWGSFGATPNMLRLEAGGSILITREPYTSLYDKDENRIWAMKEGLTGSLVLPWPTLNSHVKKMLLKGEPEPPGTKVWAKTKIKYTRSDNELDATDEEDDE